MADDIVQIQTTVDEHWSRIKKGLAEGRRKRVLQSEDIRDILRSF